MHYPVLNRGLKLLETILLHPHGCRSVELKKTLNIGDASLHRLLKSLIDLDWIQSHERGHYLLGPKGLQLKDNLLHHPYQSQLEFTLSELSHVSQQSSAWCTLKTDKIVCQAHCQIPDSIVVMPAGSLLHAEHDHAGALAILDQCDPAEQTLLMESEGSTMTSDQHLKDTLKKVKKHDFFLDLSTKRRGVSRCAIGFEFKQDKHCIFLCGTTHSIRSKWRFYRDCLLNTLENLKTRSL
jgi:DNA-binding IclR family transcriptional regulator